MRQQREMRRKRETVTAGRADTGAVGRGRASFP
jgi:hypothetical protein